MDSTSDKQADAQPKPAADAAEVRHDLFEMIAQIAALAHRRGEKSIAVMLAAVVEAYG